MKHFTIGYAIETLPCFSSTVFLIIASNKN